MVGEISILALNLADDDREARLTVRVFKPSFDDQLHGSPQVSARHPEYRFRHGCQSISSTGWPPTVWITLKLQLVNTTAHRLRSVQRQLERIRKYFEHGPVRYAARFKFNDAGSIIRYRFFVSVDS